MWRVYIRRMTVDDYRALSAFDIHHRVTSGTTSAREFAQHALELAESTGRELNAFITICTDKALAQADDIDRNVAAGESVGPMAGVPIVLKDNISYRDYPLTCASKILNGYVPPFDATAAVRLVEAGAVIIGKANMDEFAMGSSNENSAYGPVHNPVDHSLAPGGSSGGSAAVVAAGIVPIAYGSETGGSVRQPAAFCGTYGFKPTYGGISRFGLVAFASSCDVISPLARDPRDLALAYKVASGHDHNDSTSLDFEHPDYPNDLELGRKLTIGVPADYFPPELDSDVRAVVDKAIDALKTAGHSIVDVKSPMSRMAIPIYYIVASAEASANLARYDGVRYGKREGADLALHDMYAATRAKGFGDEVKRRIMLGTYALSSGYYDAYYQKASDVRQLLREEFARLFDEVDLLITPTSPTPAFKLGERIDDPLAMYLSDMYTAPSSLAGNPAISIPYGSVPDGRPVGVQLIAALKDDRTLFQAAASLA